MNSIIGTRIFAEFCLSYHSDKCRLTVTFSTAIPSRIFVVAAIEENEDDNRPDQRNNHCDDDICPWP